MLNRFFPKKQEEQKIKIADLDKVLLKNYTITLHGKNHEVKSPSLIGFLEVVDASNKVYELQRKESVTQEELINAYYNFISKMCPTITKEDISQAQQLQLLRLWHICVDMMSGYEEKKTLLSMMMIGLKKEQLDAMIGLLTQLQSTSPESLQKYAAELAGQSSTH